MCRLCTCSASSSQFGLKFFNKHNMICIPGGSKEFHWSNRIMGPRVHWLLRGDPFHGRGSLDLQHWFVRIAGADWKGFPAKANGSAEHRIVTLLGPQHLNKVPLWLAFNTGLLECIEKLNLERVA